MKSKRICGLFLVLCGILLAVLGFLSDDTAIVIPSDGEPPQYTVATEQMTETEAEPPTSYDDGLVNINTADVGELMTLPGIGAVKARAIIEYREQNGRFLSTEDLMNISGIGEKTYEKLRGYCTVD